MFCTSNFINPIIILKSNFIRYKYLHENKFLTTRQPDQWAKSSIP